MILIFTLSLPTYAMHLSEDRIINRELTVEEDESIVNNSIEGKDDDERDYHTFMMSLPVYLKRVFFPFLMLFAIGPLYLLIEYEIKNFKEKSRSN